MGCTHSSNTTPQHSPNNSLKSTGVQDDARSFRSKHSAIKMLTKNKMSCQALMDYLSVHNKVELLTCYMDLEEIRQLTEEQALTRASALVWRYKTQFESVRKNDQNSKAKCIEIVVWECLGRLRYVDGGNIESDHLLKMIQNSQNDLLSKLIIPFEGFLCSKQYKAWQDAHVEDEKKRQISKPNLTPSNSILGMSGMNGGSMTPNSFRQDSIAAIYSNVLIVDDSMVTLKLTRLTLEKDGHNVDKALNGQIALDMLKQRIYDVVLIDLNMPVMDGFETIRLFREYENSHLRSLTAPIPKRTPRVGGGRTSAGNVSDDGNVSDLSDDEALTMDEPVAPTLKASRFAMADPNFGHSRGAGAGAVGRGGYGTRGTLSEPTSPSASSFSPTAANSQLIIGMSTDVDKQTRMRALEAGMDYFLPKPFTLQKFTEIIRASIEKKTRENSSMHLSTDFSVSSIPVFNNNSLYSP